jgi:predicted  nucleic acid-binding Zn-ribbon protein
MISSIVLLPRLSSPSVALRRVPLLMRQTRHASSYSSTIERCTAYAAAAPTPKEVYAYSEFTELQSRTDMVDGGLRAAIDAIVALYARVDGVIADQAEAIDAVDRKVVTLSDGVVADQAKSIDAVDRKVDTLSDGVVAHHVLSIDALERKVATLTDGMIAKDKAIEVLERKIVALTDGVVAVQRKALEAERKFADQSKGIEVLERKFDEFSEMSTVAAATARKAQDCIEDLREVRQSDRQNWVKIVGRLVELENRVPEVQEQQSPRIRELENTVTRLKLSLEEANLRSQQLSSAAGISQVSSPLYIPIPGPPSHVGSTLIRDVCMQRQGDWLQQSPTHNDRWIHSRLLDLERRMSDRSSNGPKRGVEE